MRVWTRRYAASLEPAITPPLGSPCAVCVLRPIQRQRGAPLCARSSRTTRVVERALFGAWNELVHIGGCRSICYRQAPKVGAYPCFNDTTERFMPADNAEQIAEWKAQWASNG